MIAFPDISLTPRLLPLYSALARAGDIGLTGREILTTLYGADGDRVPAKHAASRLGRLREHLRSHGMEVLATRRGGEPDGRFCLRWMPQESAEELVQEIIPDARIIAGFKVYQHVVGTAFDTAGDKVTLRYVEGLRP